MSSSGNKETLRGLTLKVYLFVLKRRKPVGVREVQRGLELSSPSLASYHLAKLEESGFLKREGSGYVVNKLVIGEMIRLGSILLPRYLFYATFFTVSLAIQLTLFKPHVLTSSYFFSTLLIFVSALIFCYETVKTSRQQT